MLPYRDSWITKAALVIFFMLVLAYGYFEAQGFLFGPSITLTPGLTEVHDPYVTVKGVALRISSLAMNGKQITVTEDGSFNEPYLLARGLNRIVLDATDKYGRSRREVLEVVYTPAAAASTTAQTTVSTTSASWTNSTSSPPASTGASASTSPMAQ